MELFDLKVFVIVAEEGNVTRAARRLAMTQPGVSQHLSRLEGELGKLLFEREGKHLYLNDFGREFLGRARGLLEEASRLMSFATGAVCPVGSLRLGLTDSSTTTVIPPALAKFRELYPGVRMRFDVDDSSDIEADVLRGHYDFGIVTAGSHPHPQLNEEVLYYDRIDALVSKKHPLAKKKRISMETLSGFPLLVYPRRSRTRLVIDNAFHSANIIPKEIIDVYINTAAVRLAEVGIGVALLSEAFIKEEIPKHRCVHLRISGDPFKRAICIIQKHDAHLSEAAKCFYNILTEHT